MLECVLLFAINQTYHMMLLLVHGRKAGENEKQSRTQMIWSDSTSQSACKSFFIEYDKIRRSAYLYVYCTVDNTRNKIESGGIGSIYLQWFDSS